MSAPEPIVQNTPLMLDRLRSLVDMESPATDPQACRAVLESCGDHYDALGATVELTPGDDGTPVLVARFGAQRRPGLLIGHVDTVFPIGELAQRPFIVHDGRAYGPGVLDMKGGLVQLEFALSAVVSTGAMPDLTVLLNADEELGSPGSQSVIRAEAARADWALVLEPATASGAVKSARKGIGMYSLEVTGRATHPGTDFAAGVNAALEAAHQILALQALTDLAAGTTVNIGVTSAGTARNVVPASATIEFETRFWTADEAQRIDRAIRALCPVDGRAKLALSGGIHKPPMVRDAGAVALFEVARHCARAEGWELHETSVGGVSDGNVTAAMGVPTLDGFGAVGDGAHGVNEYIVVNEMPIRSAWLARLIERLTSGLNSDSNRPLADSTVGSCCS